MTDLLTPKPIAAGEFLNGVAQEIVTAILGSPFILTPPMPAPRDQEARIDLLTRVQNKLEQIFLVLRKPCRACEATSRLNHRRDALRMAQQHFEHDAADLFLKGQDQEAVYLRDRIIHPLENWMALESKAMADAWEGFHTCTKDGSYPRSEEKPL